MEVECGVWSVGGLSGGGGDLEVCELLVASDVVCLARDTLVHDHVESPGEGEGEGEGAGAGAGAGAG